MSEKQLKKEKQFKIVSEEKKNQIPRFGTQAC